VIPSLRYPRALASALALGAVAACAPPPSFDSSVAPLPRAALSAPDWAADSIDVLQCAQRVAARGGFFIEDTTGTVLVRQPGTTPDQLVGAAVPARRPAALPTVAPIGLAGRPAGARQVRILLAPRERSGWVRANARAPGSRAASTRELVQLINAQCATRRA
jgi:hypothetical protein